MTTPALIADLKRDEGLRLVAYPDPLSGGDPWTIGYGHTGSDVHKGVVWTPDQADHALLHDVANVVVGLDQRFPWWRKLGDVRQDVLVNMGFNLGLAGLATFTTTLGKMQAADYAGASAGMLASKWAMQVKGRAQRLAAMMKTGVRS